MSKRKKTNSTPASSYGSTYNTAIVDRKKENGVSVNGVKVSSNVDAHENYDARGGAGVGIYGKAPQSGSASKTKIAGTEQKNGLPGVFGQIYKNIPGTQSSTIAKPDFGTGYGVKPDMQNRNAYNMIQGVMSGLFGKKQADGPQTKKTASGLQKTDAGSGIGAMPNQRAINQMDAQLASEYLNGTAAGGPQTTANVIAEKIEKSKTDAAAIGQAAAAQADFQARSNPNAAVVANWNDPNAYYYINNIAGANDKANRKPSGDLAYELALALNPDMAAGANAAAAAEHISNKDFNAYTLTDQEKQIYNYLAATKGEKAAQSYLDTIRLELNARTAQDVSNFEQTVEKSPVVASLLSVPMNTLGAYEGLGVMVGGIGDVLGADGGEIEINDPRLIGSRASSNIRSEISSKMTPAGAFFYQTGMSMLDTASRLPLGNAGLAIAGFGSSAQTADEAIMNGASAEQALILAGVSGALEIVTEKLSLDNLFTAKAAGTLSGVIKAALRQAGIEASEEASSAIGNVVADILVRKDQSAWNQEIVANMRAGMTREEAQKKTLISQMLQVVSQAAGGFVSGLFFGGGGQVVNAYNIGKQQGTKGVKAVGAGMQAVASYDAATKAYKQAVKASPRYTAEARIAIARDLESSGLSSTDKDGIASMIDHFAMQPDGWITERGQELTELAIQATRQAAEKGHVATAQLEARQTRARARLSTMFSDVQAAYRSTEDALKAGDILAHTKMVQAATAAIEKYNNAFATEQADIKAQKARKEADQRAADEAIASAARKLKAQVPAEVENHVQIAAQLEAQDANETAVSDNGSANFANDPTQTLKTADTAAPDAQVLTSQPETGIVSTAGETAQAASAAVAPGTFNLVGSVMKNASGVPAFKQQTTTRGNPNVDIIKNIVNGGNPNGEQGRNASQLVEPGSQQGGAGNEPANSGSVRQDGKASGRNIPSAGRGGSDRADARGGQVPASGVWNEVIRGDLAKATASINEELTRAGIAPLADGDLIPVETLDQESAYWLNRMESLTGRKALIFASKSGRTDFPLAFANNGREHVRYQPGRIMAFHFAHEIAENSSRIRAAGEKVLKSIGDDSFKNYLRIKGAEGADVETQRALRKEFVCDAYAAVMFDFVARNRITDQLGINDGDYEEFVNAFADHLASPAISEETLDKETRANMRGAAFSSTHVEDMTARDDALRARNEERAEAFADELEEWRRHTDAKPFDLGRTPSILQRIGVEEKPVVLSVSDLNHMQRRAEMTDDVVRQIPDAIQNPILVMESRTVPDRITLFGEVFDTKNNPVLVILDLEPSAEKGHNPETLRVANAYGKDKNPQWFIENSRILYVANEKRTRSWMELSGLQLPSSAIHGFNNIVSRAQETVNTRDGDGTEFSSTDIADPQTDPYAAEAYRLYGDGVTYEAYMNKPDADWRVGKQLYGMWNGIRKIRVMQRALDLFENKVTPAQYWQQNKTHWGKEGDQDTQVLSQLYGMYLRNNIPMGGRLGEGEGGQLETLLKDIGKARQFHQLTLTGKSPVRVFEDILAYRKENSVANIAANVHDSKMMRETYFDNIMEANGSRAAYMKAAREKVFEAYKGGSVRESNLAQLLGEKIVDKENLKQALYDGKHMLVRAIDGWFVFEQSGKLLAFCDGETTFFRDPNANKTRKAADKASTEDKTPTQKARERLKEKFTQLDKSVIRVDRKGNNAVIYIPGIRNPVQIHNGKMPNAEIAIRTADALTAYYAQAWEDQSRILVENGYAPAKFIPDYFPHLWQEESGLNGVIEAFVGYEPPTQIAGITGAFKPGKPWAAHLQERTGPLTEFDAIRGFNQYVQKAGDVIFMTPTVQRLRQLESYLRVNAGEKFDATAHSTLVEWLRKYGNDIANKKAELDRSAESLFGHEAFSISRAATTLISRSAVQGSLSSALSQTISYIVALPTLSAKSAVKGTRQAIVQSMLAMVDSKHYDKFEDKVPFLKARFGAYEEILMKSSQKADRAVNNTLSWLFTAMDRFATEAVARAKFDELRSKGRTEEEAGRETSVYCVKLFADRSKGMAPVLLNNKVLKPFLQFQLEVENQIHHFRDIKRQSAAEAYDLLTNPQMADKRAKQGISEDLVKQLLGESPLSMEATKLQNRIMASGNAKKWMRMLMYLVFLSLWGEFTRATMGRDQTWNPYGMAKDFVQDVKNEGVPAAAVNLGANVIEQLPYASFATGGRVPIGAGIDKFATVAKDVYDGISEGDWKGLGRHALMAGAAITPAGGQARKIGTGIEANTKKGYYTDNGELRYPVTEKDYVKTILFGPSAAAPAGYDWNDKLSVPKTEAYQSMVEKGLDPRAAYTMLLNSGGTNAEKGLAILTTDSDGDGNPDFKPKDYNLIASIMGFKYDSTKDGSFQDWTKKAASDYIEKAQKDGATPAQQKTIDHITRMMKLIHGK